MVFYEVYSHSELKRYKATIFSKASLVQLVCIVITFLCPFIIVYFAGGFWIKEKLNSEHAKINFQYRYLAFFETERNFYLTSSYENVNQIYSDASLPAIRSVYETDSDNDGKNDMLQFDLFVSGIPSLEVVKSIKILLIFNNTLTKYANVKFESVGYLETSNSKVSNDMSFSGELEMFQTKKFIDKVSYTDYNFQSLNETNMDLEDLKISNILQAYYERPYGTRMKTDYVTWTNKNADGFHINAKVRYAPYQIVYVPAFWEQIKWGWIQYFSVVVPFIYVFRLVKIFIFENQLVPVITVMGNNKVKTT